MRAIAMGPADIVASWIHEQELFVVTATGWVWRWDEQADRWEKIGPLRANGRS